MHKLYSYVHSRLLFLIYGGGNRRKPIVMQCTYHPGLVHEIVDGMQRIDARDASVLQAEYDVLPVVGRISSVLPQQHEVWLDRSDAAATSIRQSNYKVLKQPRTDHLSTSFSRP